MKGNVGRWLLGAIAWVGWSSGGPWLYYPLSAAATTAGLKTAEQVDTRCPTDIKVLSKLLLADLPSYTNRVIQRQQQSSAIRNYIIVASQPEFTPLVLSSRQYQPVFPDSQPQQIFFSLLERQYFFNQIQKVQQYYWLFLANTASGWRLVSLYSRRSPLAEDGPISPLQESSDSFVAQAIRLWLKDCRAGAINPTPED